MAAADESPIYHDLMRFKPEELSPNAWAVKAGVSRTVWADMRRHGNPSRRTLEKLLTTAGSSLAEFEALRIAEPRANSPVAEGLADPGASSWVAARLPPLPLIAASLVGEWGGAGSGIQLIELRADRFVDRLARPPSLAGDAQAYAVTIVGDSMWPRFRPGRRVAVSPASPVSIGDDVLLTLATDRAERRGLIGDLLKRTNETVELRQFNPDVIFAVATDEIEALHKIVGELF